MTTGSILNVLNLDLAAARGVVLGFREKAPDFRLFLGT